MKFLKIGTATIFMFFATLAQASHFEIIFTEGAYEYDISKSETDTENKYLAQVIIKKDGVIMNQNEVIKGSTIPDSWFFYEVWRGEGNITPPNDEDIEKIFNEWEDKSTIPNDYNLLDNNLIQFINDINDVFEKATYIPVIHSGTYKFKIGLHKNGQSSAGLGLPDVPRLIGSYKPQKSYDGRSPDESTLQIDGGYIATINKNTNQNQEKVACGINIHDGRHDSFYIKPSKSKFSIGCITIHPDHWYQFNSKLPNINDWDNEDHTGTVIIIRQTTPDPSSEAPSDIPRIQSVQAH